LYAAIWQPLEEHLKGVSSIYFSPSGLLHKVSFNAIPVSDGKRLVDIYDLNLVSSTREITRRNRDVQRPRSAVVYGGLFFDLNEDIIRREAAVYQRTENGVQTTSVLPADTLRGTSWKYLQFTKTEVTAISSLLTRNNIQTVLFDEAKGNKESFLNLNGKKYEVIHLATHGFFIEDIEKKYEEQERLERLGGGRQSFENPLMRSGLILSGGNNAWVGDAVEGVENGILFADDVAKMNLLGAQLVVLSACETGLGVVNNSEGVFGLQRAFKLAGAETLIISLWMVSDLVSSEFMTAFYTLWLSGMSKQEAFKEAQKQIRSTYPSPYHWAAFVLVD